MVNDVLRWSGDDIATADQTHLVHVGNDVVTDALIQFVSIVRAATAPAFRRKQSSRSRHGRTGQAEGGNRTVEGVRCHQRVQRILCRCLCGLP